MPPCFQHVPTPTVYVYIPVVCKCVRVCFVLPCRYLCLLVKDYSQADSVATLVSGIPQKQTHAMRISMPWG